MVKKTLPLYAAASLLDEPNIPHQLYTFLIKGPFLNQKSYKDIRI